MKNKKMATLVASLALVAALGVGATLAYFTDSDEKTNTITMGNVDIDLDEPDWDDDNPDGEIDDVKPGQEIDKDPTITVTAGSESLYLRAKIEYTGLNDAQIADLEPNIDINRTNWVKAEDGYYYYQTKVEKNVEAQEIEFFNKVTIPSSWGNEIANVTFTIDVSAEAVQADNFTPETNNAGQIIGWNDVTIETYNPSGSQE